MVISAQRLNGSRLTAQLVMWLQNTISLIIVILSLSEKIVAQDINIPKASNPFPVNFNVGIGSANLYSVTGPPKPLHLFGSFSNFGTIYNNEPAIRLSLGEGVNPQDPGGIVEKYVGHLTLVPTSYQYAHYGYLPSGGDMLLVAGEDHNVSPLNRHANNLFLSTRRTSGNIIFTTTSPNGVSGSAGIQERERMVITADGRIRMGTSLCDPYMRPFLRNSNTWGVANGYDVHITSQLCVGDPQGPVVFEDGQPHPNPCISSGRAGLITLFGSGGHSFANLRNQNGELRIGSGTTSSLIDYISVTGWGGMVGIGTNLSTATRPIKANLIVSQMGIPGAVPFLLNTVMRVERREANSQLYDDNDKTYKLISAGHHAEESFTVDANGAVFSAPLIGSGKRIVYATPTGIMTSAPSLGGGGTRRLFVNNDGELTTIAGDAVDWSLSGNSPSASDFLGTVTNTPLNIKTNNQTRVNIAGDGKVEFFGNNATPQLVFTNDGKVYIGGFQQDAQNASYKLAVKGKIVMQEGLVKLANWSDYVFKKDYKLLSLDEVEHHINEHGHLPEIPSEKEVVENGVEIGVMTSKLLAKIEELTLHLIDIKKENVKLKTLIQEIEKRITKH